jgi:hypothetical protein
MEPAMIRLHFVEAGERVVDSRRELRLNRSRVFATAVEDEFRPWRNRSGAQSRRRNYRERPMARKNPARQRGGRCI